MYNNIYKFLLELLLWTVFQVLQDISDMVDIFKFDTSSLTWTTSNVADVCMDVGIVGMLYSRELPEQMLLKKRRTLF